MIKAFHSPNLVEIGSWEPEIWPHEYLLAPLKSVKIGMVPNSYEPGQFPLLSMGLIKYSCGHILGPHHELIHVKFGVWGFFIIYWSMVIKMLKCKNENFMTSHFGDNWQPSKRCSTLRNCKYLVPSVEWDTIGGQSFQNSL